MSWRDPVDPPRRRSIRLAGFDYTRNRSYFITVCAANQRCLFGRVVHGRLQPSLLGSVLAKEWERTASLRPYVESQVFVVMPNHFHALFTLLRDGMFRDDAGRRTHTDRWGALLGLERQSVSAILRAFKSAVTRRARMELGHQGPVWQRNYYEHIIRNDREFLRAWGYIVRNPERWEEDKENPSRRLQSRNVPRP